MLLKRLSYFTVSIIEYLLIILFTYTGLSKLLDLDTFQFQTHRSPYLENISTFVSYTIPPAEMLIVLAFVLSKFQAGHWEGRFFDWFRRYGPMLEYWAMGGSLFLMSLFTGYVWLMLNYAYYLPCSCGGIMSTMSWHSHLIFNAVFTGLASLALILIGNRLRTKNITQIVATGEMPKTRLTE
jgi:hypothetical protein